MSMAVAEYGQACRLEVPIGCVFLLEYDVMLFKCGHVGTTTNQSRSREHGYIS